LSMYVKLCKSEDIPEGEMRQYEAGESTVLICRQGGQLFAADAVCPHRGAHLGGGTLDGTIVTCPWHEWSFDLSDGCGVTNPRSGLQCFAVHEDDGFVLVDLPEDCVKAPGGQSG